MQYIPMIILNT